MRLSKQAIGSPGRRTRSGVGDQRNTQGRPQSFRPRSLPHRRGAQARTKATHCARFLVATNPYRVRDLARLSMAFHRLTTARARASAARYQRKYKICGHHTTSPVISMSGVPHRFCQKCSRFQDLAEFDGLKRSCRQSLEAYNKRRRAKSALARRDAHGRKSSPIHPREDPSKRGERPPVPEGNPIETGAEPASWSNLDLCMPGLEDACEDSVLEEAEALNAFPFPL